MNLDELIQTLDSGVAGYIFTGQQNTGGFINIEIEGFKEEYIGRCRGGSYMPFTILKFPDKLIRFRAWDSTNQGFEIDTSPGKQNFYSFTLENNVKDLFPVNKKAGAKCIYYQLGALMNSVYSEKPRSLYLTLALDEETYKKVIKSFSEKPELIKELFEKKYPVEYKDQFVTKMITKDFEPLKFRGEYKGKIMPGFRLQFEAV